MASSTDHLWPSASVREGRIPVGRLPVLVSRRRDLGQRFGGFQPARKSIATGEMWGSHKLVIFAGPLV
jgi:hypothetical protein